MNHKDRMQQRRVRDLARQRREQGRCPAARSPESKARVQALYDEFCRRHELLKLERQRPATVATSLPRPSNNTGTASRSRDE